MSIRDRILKSPHFHLTVAALGEGISAHKVDILREGMIAYAEMDLKECTDNKKHVFPIFRRILQDYVPDCSIAMFMAELSGFVVTAFALGVQGRFAETDEPEIAAMIYLAHQFPIDFPHLVTRA